MTLKRRELLEGAGLTVASLLLSGVTSGCDDEGLADACRKAHPPLPTGLPEYAYAGEPGPASLFEHGVVSGDPLTDRVILWTRVSPPTEGPIEVFYEVALDTGFRHRVAAGTATTDASKDYTLKVDATGLSEGSTYFYRFRALGVTSRVGRTRTAPSGASTQHLRFAVMSCSSYAHGYFHAYEKVAARTDLDAVLHLGDYIYEYGTGEYGDVRPYEPSHEIVTLDDYRKRYAYYRKDLQLQAAHAQHPFVCIWDDHEVADNSYDGGAENHQPATEGPFAARLAAASQAYREYMPIREEVAGSIYRKLAYGDLLDLVMLDTRNHARSKQLGANETDDPTRTLLGFDQEAWLDTTLAESSARWVVIAQQVMVAQLSIDTDTHAPLNTDQWDGYPYARDRLLDSIEANAAGRSVILTGDIHSSWASDVSRDPWDPAVYDPATGEGAITVELVCPGVTSPGLQETATGEDFFGGLVLDACPHVKYGNFTKRGYFVLDVRPDKVQADWFHLASVIDPSGTTESFVAARATYRDDPRIQEMDAPETGDLVCELAP